MNRWQLMKQETIRSRQCESGCFKKLKLVIRAVDQANGRLVKLRCLLNNIKKTVEATETNGKKAFTEEPEQMDLGEMANPKW